MTVREKLVLDIKAIENPSILNQIQEFIALIKRNMPQSDSNIEMVLSNSGMISDSEATELHDLIDKEFNNIEGDW